MSTRLHQLGAINPSELERVGQKVPELGTANRALYEILVGDPDKKKLNHLSTALKEDTSHGNHKELAEVIDKYLASKLFSRFGGHIHEIISELCNCYDMDHWPVHIRMLTCPLVSLVSVPNYFGTKHSCFDA